MSLNLQNKFKKIKKVKWKFSVVIVNFYFRV
jgi:hypothetical protein